MRVSIRRPVRVFIRPVRVLEKAALPSPHTLQQSDAEQWLDREITSLRQSVETHALGQQASVRGADAGSPRLQLRRFGTTRAGAGWIAHRAVRVPMRFNRLLRQLRRVVYRRRFEIAFYAASVVLAFTAAWVLLSMLEP